MEKFGINCDYSEHVSSGSMFISPNDLPTKIKDLESKLQMAKKSGNKAEIDNLEWEIQTLKDQQQKKVSKLSSSHWPWIVGIGSLFLIGVAVGFGIVAKQTPPEAKL